MCTAHQTISSIKANTPPNVLQHSWSGGETTELYTENWHSHVYKQPLGVKIRKQLYGQWCVLFGLLLFIVHFPLRQWQIDGVLAAQGIAILVVDGEHKLLFQLCLLN